MTPAARIAAAIEVLSDIGARRRPAAEALKDWGIAHRFAGSGDRAAIADLVYDTLRHRASTAWALGDDTPRMTVLGTVLPDRDAAETARAAWAGDRHAPTLSQADLAALDAGTRAARLEGAPAWVRGDYPEWLDPGLAAAFGEDRVEEGRALAGRPPTDLRANTLRTSRDALLDAFRRKDAVEAAGPQAVSAGRWSPVAVRMSPAVDTRRLALTATPEFLNGDFEIQDEGSQLTALFSGAKPGEQVGDLCAGGGGKTLAIAALMGNQGRILAYDVDPRRLARADERLKRAGIGNAELRFPGRDALADLRDRLDLAFVDAPCTGTGTWRRNPDAKWRVRPGALEQRRRDQQTALALAAGTVRVGGRIAYVTCSVLPQENDEAVGTFLGAHPAFRPLATGPTVRAALADSTDAFLRAALPTRHGLQMTPRRTGTDGFYFALMEKIA